MSKLCVRGIGVVIMTALFAAVPHADQQPADSKPCGSLVGTWRLASAAYGGNDFRFPAGTTTLKHITPAHFMWVTYGADGIVTRTAGGAYTLTSGTYRETPEYGISSDFDVVRGKPQTFTCRIEGARWRHTGALSNGLTIDEVWERVESK